jgi:hypothetical protein
MKKAKAKKKAPKKVGKPIVPLPSPPEENDPFDFGGIPIRDLKKNLGCG